MTLSKREADAVREIVALPADDWSAHDWSVFEVCRSALGESLRYHDANVARQQERRQGGPRPIPRRREPAALRDARQVVYGRSGGFCEANTPACPAGPHNAEHVHHRKGRQGHDAHSPEMLLHVCNAGHRYIHDHPAESIERGWMVKRLGVES